MRRNAFSIVELLVVLTIIVILAALLFPVFVRAKISSKQEACVARLRQMAVAFNLYRSDNDGKGYLWAHGDRTGNRYPYNNLAGMSGYFRSPDIVWCTEPNIGGMFGDNFHNMAAWPLDLHDSEHTTLWRSWQPIPGSVVVTCTNHASLENDPRFTDVWSKGFLRVGTYLFAREDTSAGTADSRQMRVYWCGRSGCYDSTPPTDTTNTLRFPGAPWPPVAEE